MRAPERTLLAAAAALALAAPLGAQASAAAAPPPAEASLPDTEIYRREVFRYQAGGRPDPFQPLLSGDELGVRVQDLRLVGIIHTGNPRTSVATFTQAADSTQRIRLRVGQRVGSVTLLSIQPRRVDVREDEIGVSRVYSLELQRPRRGVSTPEGAPPPPQQPQQQQPAAPAQPAPAGGRP